MTHELNVYQKLGLGAGILCLTFTVAVAVIAVLAQPSTKKAAVQVGQTPGGVISISDSDSTGLQQTSTLQSTQALYSNTPTAQAGGTVSQSATPALQ